MRRWRSGKNGKAAKQQSSRAAEKWRNSKGKVRPTRAVDDALAGRNPRYGVLRITGDLKRKLKSKGGRKSLSEGANEPPLWSRLKNQGRRKVINSCGVQDSEGDFAKLQGIEYIRLKIYNTFGHCAVQLTFQLTP